jgi:hypothetical protein
MQIKLNEVTWYSKLSAAIFLLGVFPAISFYIGMEYQKAKTTFELVSVSPHSIIPTDDYNIVSSKKIFTTNQQTYVNDEYGFSFEYPSFFTYTNLNQINSLLLANYNTEESSEEASRSNPPVHKRKDGEIDIFIGVSSKFGEVNNYYISNLLDCKSIVVGAKVINCTDIKIDGVHYKKILTSFPPNSFENPSEKELLSYGVIADLNGKIYQSFAYFLSTTNNKSFIDLADEIYNSFKIK